LIQRDGARPMILKNTTFAAALLAGTAAAALFPQGTAQAEECLLDSTNDGVATGADTDGGATSDNGRNSNLACGVGADATSQDGGSTAVGGSSLATLDYSSAFGYQAEATATAEVGRAWW